MCLIVVLTVQLCTVSVVVGVDAKLIVSSVDDFPLSDDDVRQTENRILSHWREVSADERRQLHDGDSEILRPLDDETSLVVIRRANGMYIALYFICMTLSALMSLRDQWCSQQLRDIVQSLFTFLSDATDMAYDTAGDRRTIRVNRLTWPLIDYERCLGFFSSVQG